MTIYDYILCAIENWLDLFNHISNIKVIDDKALLKFSKYIYRIYYCWNHILKYNINARPKIIDIIKYCFDEYGLFKIITRILHYRAGKDKSKFNEIRELLYRSFGLECDTNTNYRDIKFNIVRLKSELIEQINVLVKIGKKRKYTKKKR